MKNKKILITGATGFVGANLAGSFLRRGADVSVFTRKTSDLWRIRDISDELSSHLVDLRDADTVKKVVADIKPDIIIHSGVYGGYPDQDDVDEISEVNLNGTVNLLNAAVDTGFEVFINTGSSSEYGIKQEPMKETDSLEPVTAYGKAKAEATRYCCKTARETGLAITTLRLFSPYGYYEGKSRLVPSVILSCLKGVDPRLSSPDSVRDFIFIEDTVTAYEQAIENAGRISGEVFNIGGGVQHSVGEVVEFIVDAAGEAVKPCWGKIDNKRQEPSIWQADISKAWNILGWEPVYTLDSGLKKNVEWFKENIELYQ